MESFLTIIFLLILYFIPTYVAAKRRHRNSTAILMLNLFTGWTVIGWIGCIIWASTCNTKD